MRSKVIPQQAEVAQGVPGRLRLRIFLTFGATRVVGRQPYAPAAFTSGEIPGINFHCTWFRRGEPRKKSLVTPPGIDPGTVRLVAQYLNHYATPGPSSLRADVNFKHIAEFFLVEKVSDRSCRENYDKIFRQFYSLRDNQS
jgi:hypothetical protein